MTVLAASGIGVWIWDLVAGSIVWSLPGSDGQPDINLILQSAAELVDLARAEDRESLADAFRSVEKGGTRLNHTFELAGPNSRVIRIEATRFENAPQQVVGISVDETTHANDKLRLSALFEERDGVARALETSLLPRALPHVPGLSIDAAYKSSEGAATGDFYDLFPIEGGDWALSIGDVGGHGAAAAAITTSVRYSLRAAALIRRNPSRVLRAANAAHLHAALDERFTTCHFVRMQRTPTGYRLRIGTAGHPDLLIKRANGRIERFAGSGPMLGLLRTPEFLEARTILRFGDVLVAFTDGVTEAREGSTFFGEDGLATFLTNWTGSIKGFSESLHSQALSSSGGIARDDMATVAIQVVEL